MSGFLKQYSKRNIETSIIGISDKKMDLKEGNLRVISKDNDTLNLKAGEPIIELVNSWHYGENLGTEPAEIIVFYAGIKGTPITVLKESNH